MNRVRISARAAADLREIRRYGIESFGKTDALGYIGKLSDSIALIRTNPLPGVPADHIRAGYRSHRAGIHILFYAVRGSDIVIVRVLHSRMDLRRQFVRDYGRN